MHMRIKKRIIFIDSIIYIIHLLCKIYLQIFWERMVAKTPVRSKETDSYFTGENYIDFSYKLSHFCQSNTVTIKNIFLFQNKGF